MWRLSWRDAGVKGILRLAGAHIDFCRWRSDWVMKKLDGATFDLWHRNHDGEERRAALR